jgi:hypothetical protein
LTKSVVARHLDSSIDHRLVQASLQQDKIPESLNQEEVADDGASTKSKN